MSRAIILAGGLGTRLRPYTAILPKPLMPVGDRPILDIILRQLVAADFRRITIATGYLAELIEAFFRDGSAYGVPIDYFREREPLGTVGALALIPDLDEPFLVMNGDVLSDLEHRRLLEDHIASGAMATIATAKRHVEISLGVLRFEDPEQPDLLTGYVEKPKLDYEASMGVYCFSPEVLKYIEPGERLDFPTVVQRMIDAEESVRAWRSEAYWLDIGRHQDYEQALDEFDAMKHRFIPGPPLVERPVP